MSINRLKTYFAIALASLTLALSACGKDEIDLYDIPDPPLPEKETPPAEVADKPKAMWIDTEANFLTFANKSFVDAQIEKIKRYGFNLVYVDAKPSNGYALYKSDILPYCNTFGLMTVSRDYDDYLGYIIDKCEENDIDVVASVCVLGWGWRKGVKEQGYFFEHRDEWKDKVQVRDDAETDALVPITEDPYQSYVMLDPSFPEVQNFVARVCGELAAKYPKLKGISLDYLRYNNNDGGWFGLGDHNMSHYAAYWNESLPDRHDMLINGAPGPKFAKWIEYRSAAVTTTLSKIRDAVKAANPDCELHLWASAQWSSRYSIGQNWASKNYKPVGGQYTDTYNKTGFADLLDVFITGAYSEKVWISEDPSTEWTVENFCKSWNNYIMGECKCYGSIAAYALNATQHADATYLCLRHTDGFMTFELSHVNNRNLWQSAHDGFKRYEGNYK